MICQKCGSNIPDDSIFCTECGAKQEGKNCVKCGSTIPADSLFCPECGAGQETAAHEPAQPQPEPPQPEPPQPVQPQPAQPQPVQPQPLQLQQQETRGKNNKKLIVVLCAVLGIAVIGTAAFLLYKKFYRPSIDLNSYLSVSFDGYNSYGYALNDFHYDELLKDYEDASGVVDNCVSGHFDKDSALKNGDRITYVWECNDEEALENYGYRLDYSNIEYTVSGLKDAETFDPFKGVEVKFEGIAPNGSASVDTDKIPEEAEGLYYELDSYEGLSNGDTVTLTVSSDEDDIAEYCIESCGKIPDPLTKTYTVDGLESYVQSAEYISGDCMEKLKSVAEDVYRNTYSSYWGSDQILDSFNYLGTYFLKKDMDNEVYLVYKVKVHDSYTDGDYTYDSTDSIYWYIGFRNLINDSGNKTSTDTGEYTIPGNYFNVDSGISDGWYDTKSWSYSGYESLSKLYEGAIKPMENVYGYECESNINDIADTASSGGDNAITDDGLGEDDSSYNGEEGIIFPDSSDKLLSKKKVKKLSDEELRYAINEIYARNGYIFKDEELRDFYKKYDWYEEKVKAKDFKESMFNDIEKKNVRTMQKERDRRKK